MTVYNPVGVEAVIALRVPPPALVITKLEIVLLVTFIGPFGDPPAITATVPVEG